MEERKSLADANVQGSDKTNSDNKGAVEHPLPAEDSRENTVNEIKTETTLEKKQDGTHHEIKKLPEEHVSRRSSSHNFRKLVNSLKALSLQNIKSKLGHYWFEYSRVIHLTRRPTRSEYRELAIMVLVGTAIIGGIGFIVQLALQFV